jgi:GT2 family glycosyltransferase
MPSVDVMIPNYNYGRFLTECVESVLAQDVDDLAVTIIDNCSTDDSVAVAHALMARDQRVRLVENPRNLGAQASFNRAIDLATRDYMMILCSDDVLAPRMLRKAVDAMLRRPEAAFAIGEPATLDAPPLALAGGDRPARSRVIAGAAFIDACCRNLGNRLALGALLVRTRVQRETGHFSAELPYTDDLEMALRLAMRGSVVWFDRPLGLRREHPCQMSNEAFPAEFARLAAREAAFAAFFRRDGKNFPSARRLSQRVALRLARAAVGASVRHLRRGLFKPALDLLAYFVKLLRVAALASVGPASAASVARR